MTGHPMNKGSDAGQIVAALESFIDAKIAFAGMTPELRRNFIEPLCARRESLVRALTKVEDTE